MASIRGVRRSKGREKARKAGWVQSRAGGQGQGDGGVGWWGGRWKKNGAGVGGGASALDSTREAGGLHEPRTCAHRDEEPHLIEPMRKREGRSLSQARQLGSEQSERSARCARMVQFETLALEHVHHSTSSAREEDEEESRRRAVDAIAPAAAVPDNYKAYLTNPLYKTNFFSKKKVAMPIFG